MGLKGWIAAHAAFSDGLVSGDAGVGCWGRFGVMALLSGLGERMGWWMGGAAAIATTKVVGRHASTQGALGGYCWCLGGMGVAGWRWEGRVGGAGPQGWGGWDGWDGGPAGAWGGDQDGPHRRGCERRWRT